MNQKIELATRQNPKNFTQQLQTRHANKILANNLVRIKPMVDTRVPKSYKSTSKHIQQKQSFENRTRQSSQHQNEALIAEMSQHQISQNARSLDIGGFGGHDNNTNTPGLENNMNSLEDPLNRFSTGQESMDQQDQAAVLQYMEAYGSSAAGGAAQDQQYHLKMGRGPNDSLMSAKQQQSVSQHQGGGSVTQQSQGPRMKQAAKDRQRQIDSENSILLNKMMSILNRKQNKDQGLIRGAKGSTVSSQSTGGNNRGARLANSVPEVLQPAANYTFGQGGPTTDVPPESSHYYLSDNSRSNFGQAHPQQQIYLAPRLDSKSQHAGIQMGAYVAPPRSGKTTNDSQRFPGFQVVYTNNPQQHAALIQQQHQQNQSMQGDASSTNNRLRSVLVPMPRTPGTLNFSSRKQQIQKINQENLHMLKTLQQTKPTTSFEKWRQHAKRQELYKKNISNASYQGAAEMVNSLSQGMNRRQMRGSGANPQADNNMINHPSSNLENPFRAFLRSKVKSGSLPARSNFYIHKQHVGGSDATASKKAYSTHNYNGTNRQIKLPNKRAGNNVVQQQQWIAQQPQQPQQRIGTEQQQNHQSMEVAQKIESVINMFPQPTEEQLDQFKELQESETELGRPSHHEAIQQQQLHDPNTITNIQLYKDENLNQSDPQVQHYNLDLRKSDHNMVSQNIKDQEAGTTLNSAGVGARHELSIEERRVQTTMPGKRNRKLGIISGNGQQAPAPMLQVDSPDPHLSDLQPELLTMDGINPPHSMDGSLNSASHIPQIIVRKQGSAGGADTEYTGTCNPMLIPMGAPYIQQPNPQHQVMFHPEQLQQLQQVDSPQMMEQQQSQRGGGAGGQEVTSAMYVPKRSFYDYQYQDGPDYNISFDQASGQPIVSSMDAITMNDKLAEMQKEIVKRKLDDDQLAEHNFFTKQQQKVDTKQKNIKKILRAYANKNAHVGPFGTNNNVIMQLQNNRRMPLHRRKDSRQNRHKSNSIDAQNNSVSIQSNQPQQMIKRKLRVYNTQNQSPAAAQKRNAMVQKSKLAVDAKPQTSHQVTRPRIVKPLNQHDDQVGGGPVVVSPEVLRLQANRPDERQQRTRSRVVSPPQPIAEEKSDQKLEPLTQKKQDGVGQAAPQVESTKPPSQGGERKATTIAKKLENEAVPVQQTMETNKQSAHSSQGANMVPTIVSSPQGIVEKRSNANSRGEGAGDSHDQRASSTLEEGIMGLKYLPHQSQTQEHQQQPPMEMTYGSHQLDNKDKEAGEVTGEQNIVSAEDEEEKKARHQGQQPPQPDQTTTPIVSNDPYHDQEVAAGQKTERSDTYQSQNTKNFREDDGMKRANSTSQAHNQKTNTILKEKADSEIHTVSNSLKQGGVTHQDTELGLVGPRHIEDQPINIDNSEEYSANTESNKMQEEEMAVYQAGQPIIATEKDEPVRQSKATNGQPYSDFEDDDDQAAVGSGIVETNENYSDLDADGQDFGDYNGDNISVDEAQRSQKLSGRAKPQTAAAPIGQIAALMQKQMLQQDSVSDQVSDEAIVPKLKQLLAETPKDNYSEEVYTEGGGTAEMVQNTDSYDQDAEIDALDLRQEEDDDDDDDYADNEIDDGVEAGDVDDDDDDNYQDDENDFEESKLLGKKAELTGSGKHHQLSLESDQEASENEFEQIKDDEYADEDFEQSDRY